MLRAVRKIAPGQVLFADRAGIRLRRYSSTRVEPIGDLSEPEAVNLIREGFGAAVKRQMVSDVPIGSLLSGGVDSAAIVAMMSQHAGRPRTHTVGFPQGRGCN